MRPSLRFKNDAKGYIYSKRDGGRQLITYYPIAAAPVGPPVVFYPLGGKVDEDLESTEIKPPPEGASVAEAQPIGIAIAGPGGVAAAQPIGTAIVGPQGLAIARPIGTAIAGVSGVGPVAGGPGLPIAEPEPAITIYLTQPVLHPPHLQYYYGPK